MRSVVATALLPALVATAAVAIGRGAHAEGAEEDKAEADERCAIRLSVTLLGKTADADLLEESDPQSKVDAMLATPAFADRFARFINAEFNGGPGATPDEDAVYYLARHVISQRKPWTELFLGGYTLTPSTSGLEVRGDPNGLGYFRMPSWRRRYAGNEEQGYMLVAAFRILSNTTGLELVPSVGTPDDDRTAKGRANGSCKSCHFDAWYALDKFARLLPKRQGEGADMKFLPPTEGPQQLLGKSIADDKALVTSLVDSDAWRFSQCRNVFKFLYGREENQCEAAVFDRCVDALAKKKTIQAAVAAVAKDPTFCL